MIGLDPRLWLAGLLLGAAVAGGWTGRGYVEDSRRLAELRAQRHEDLRRGEIVSRSAGEHEGVKAELQLERRSIEKEVIRVVEKPVYRDVCLDDDGLRVATAAIAGRAASQPAAALPAASAAGQR